MPAVLKITADPADIRRAFGVMSEEARKWSTTVQREGRRVADEQRRNMQSAALEDRRTLAQRQREQVAALNRIVAEERKATRERERDLQKSEQLRQRYAREDVRDAERASAERMRIQRREYSQQERDANALVRARERAERRTTQIVEREARERSARLRAIGRTISGAASYAGGLAASVGSSALAMAGDVRLRRAESEHTLNSAFFQAGAGRMDASQLHERVYSFARANRMDSGELAAAINATQTEFSTIGTSRSSQGERMQNLDAVLQTALLARNTGQDVGQVARVSAMLQSAGITGGANRQALLGLTGLAQRGAIELGSVTREAMAPMQARMSQARSDMLLRNPGATEAQLADAQGREAVQAFAEIEVARGLGASPRRFSTVMRQMHDELRQTTFQNKMHTNILASRDLNESQRRGLLGMFDRGHLREQFQSGLGFAGEVNRVLGGNQSLMRNVFAGGGHGNPMSLKTNERDAIAQMMGGGAQVQQFLQGVGTDFNENDVQRGAGLFGNEQKSVMTGESEQRDATIANTDALMQTQREISALRAEFPILDSAIQHIAGDAGEAGAAKLLPGNNLPTGPHAAAQIREEAANVHAQTTKAANVQKDALTARALQAAFEAALRTAGIHVAVSPQAVSHAVGQANTSANAPTEGRR